MPDLPPIPSDVEKARAQGDMIPLPPARYLALVNWIEAARAVPAQCRAIIASEQDHKRIAIDAAIQRCESSARVAVAEASILGVPPLTVAIISIVVGVLSFGLGAIAVVFSQ